MNLEHYSSIDGKCLCLLQVYLSEGKFFLYIFLSCILNIYRKTHCYPPYIDKSMDIKGINSVVV